MGKLSSLLNVYHLLNGFQRGTHLTLARELSIRTELIFCPPVYNPGTTGVRLESSLTEVSYIR